jgi:hypothetical protein
MPPARRARQSTAAYTGVPAPDRRLSSAFTKRSKGAPAAAARIGIVGAYPPAVSAPAGHARSLREGLQEEVVQIVRVHRHGPGGTPPETAPAEVVYDLPAEEDADNQAAARVLNGFDLVVIEYDFGVYGGPDGDQVLRILEWLCVPVVVVLHSVPPEPSPGLRAVLAELTRSADAVVTLSESDRQRVHEQYRVGLRKVLVIEPPGPDGTSVAARHQELFDALLRRPSTPAR